MNDRTLVRLAPLAGLAYAVATIGGDVVIDAFPDTGTPPAELHAYYAAHHAHVAAGGMIFAWSTLLLAIFGCALWSRVRSAGAHAAVAGAVLVATAVAVVETAQEASGYLVLGDVSTKSSVTPSALQALHIAASAGALGAGVALLLLAVGVAGIVPRWLAWPAVVLALLQLTPLGFFASLLFLLWAAVTGVVLTLRPRAPMVPVPA
jgi:hypothetical protein